MHLSPTQIPKLRALHRSISSRLRENATLLSNGLGCEDIITRDHENDDTCPLTGFLASRAPLRKGGLECLQCQRRQGPRTQFHPLPQVLQLKAVID